MELNDFLASTRVALDIQAANKASLLRMLAARAAEALNVSADIIAVAIEKREELGSTGFGGGVAIPHARLSKVGQPFSFLARLSSPIEFDSIDGQNVDLAWLLLLPLASQSDQLNALATVARKLSDPDTVRKLRQATNKADIYSAIAS